MGNVEQCEKNLREVFEKGISAITAKPKDGEVSWFDEESFINDFGNALDDLIDAVESR